MKQVTKWIICTLCMSILSAEAGDVVEGLLVARQCLVVTTPSWPASKGTMSIFERDAGSKWQQRRSKIAVVVGQTGLGWGGGEIDTADLPGPRKKEGDKKAPSGIFQLVAVFGYSATAETKMPYLPLTRAWVCVDDPQSRHYGGIVNASVMQARDWRSAEEMFRRDNLYKWGVLVDHNPTHEPGTGAGSCIFLHIWRNQNKPTVGCTAMSEENLVDVICWLDPQLHPLLVQLPRSVYDERREKWKLPPF